MLFSTTLAAAAVLAFANGSALVSRANSGEATFYGGNMDGGMCSLVGYTLPAGVYGVAMTDSSWENSATCGGCIEVTGPKGNKIIAMVTDQCPSCGPNHLDLYPDAFAQLDEPSKGIIQVSWQYANCPITSPITVRNKEGTSPYWFSMQVLNANKRVASLEFSTNGGGSWTSTERKEYNYFQLSSGSGSSSVDVKVTSIDGDVVIVKDVKIGGGVTGVASGNFGPGSSAPVQAAEAPVVVPSTTSTPYIAPYVTPVVQQPTTQAVPVVIKPSTSVGAVFQESSVPAYIAAQPTTFATSTSKPASAILQTLTTTKASSSSTAIIYSITPSPVRVEVSKPVVTVTVTGCAAYLEG